MIRATFILAVGLLAGATAWAAGQEAENSLPIRRVILYTNGVGYFARQGPVDGDARIPLRFKQQEMSDLLKSMTVLDLGGGAITGIAYNSTKTVDQELADYPFNLRAAGTLPAILDQMKGAEVTVVPAGAEVSGRVLAIEKRTEHRDKVDLDAWRLSLLLNGGAVKSYDLSELTEIRFTDPKLQADLQKYLATLFRRLRRDQKEVIIATSGKGRRDVFVSYVQEQPVWKVSYRIVLEDKKKPLLQAWAIVDNVSEEDWSGVTLSLVSGLPVSFTQDLYDPWYVRRPAIQLQRETSVGPVLYEAGEQMRAPASAPAPMMAGAVAGAPFARKAEREGMFRNAADKRALASALPAAPPAPDMLQSMAQQAAAAVAQAAGALFVYDIQQPVTLQRDRSAMLPIVSSPIDGQRVSIYNESTRRDNPMEAVRLKNTTGLALEGGPVTVIEDNTYSGDALLDTFKSGEQRYISFAVDLGARVNTQLDSKRQSVFRVRIVRGTMYTEYKQQEMKTYSFVNVEPKEKTVVVEHPFREGWTLVDTQKPIEITPQHYRFEIALPAREKTDGKAELKVTEEHPEQSTVTLTNLSRDQIALFVRQKYIDDATRKVLEQVVDLQGQIADMNAQAAEQERQRQDIFNNQQRLRQNIAVLGQSEQEKELRARYVKQLGAEEDRLQDILKRVKDLKDALRQKQKELDDLLANFTFEQKI